MFNSSLADNGMNRNNPKYASIEMYICPDCGQCGEHGIYEQSFLPKLNKVLILSDCFACKNTRVLRSFRDGVEQELRK